MKDAIKMTKPEMALLRELYDLNSLLAREGGDQAGERPRKRPRTTYFRMLLRRAANEAMEGVRQVAADAADAARRGAAEKGLGQAEIAAAGRGAERETWERLTGCSGAWEWYQKFGLAG